MQKPISPNLKYNNIQYNRIYVIYEVFIENLEKSFILKSYIT